MESKSNLSGKLAVVTGGSSGIGLEFCRVLAARGANLLIVSIQEKELAEVKAELTQKFGVEVHTMLLDLTQRDASERILSYLDEHSLEADILINNAGIFSFNTLLATPQRKIDCFIDLHVRAVTDLSIAMGRRMAQRRSGRILNMSSMSCWMPMPGIAMYSATKAYIRVFSRALAYELRDSGVSVTVACPGGIATNLFGLPAPLMRLAVRIGAVQTPQKFAAKAIRRMLKGKKQYINGLINRLSIFFVATTPTCLRMQIKHRMLDRGISRP